VLRAIDAHCGGQPLRLVVDGLPTPAGSTMRARERWMARHADRLRRALVLEPRGHPDMTAACLTEPEHSGSHAGLLFMRADGYVGVCGHGLIAVATIALERGLIVHGETGGPDVPLVFDTSSGTIHARAGMASSGGRARVETAAFAAPPSFVSRPGLALRHGPRELRVDVAFGGAFHAILDAEAAGLPADLSARGELRRVAAGVLEALAGSQAVEHPVDAALSGLDGVVFTAPPRDPEAHLRTLTVYADGTVDRSPSGTGTASVMAVLAAMGLLNEGDPFVCEGPIGLRAQGHVVGRTQVGEVQAIVPEIRGSAWITGEHTFLVDEDDPLKEGVRD